MKGNDFKHNGIRKILILGCSGSGKSTLAKQLGERTGLPIIHLDSHFWRSGWVEPSKKEWEQQISNLVKQPEWIMDGNYGSSLLSRIPKADMVIVLDYPTLTCIRRVIKRVVTTYGKTRDDMAEGCKEKFDWPFMNYIWGFRKNHRPRLMQSLDAAKKDTKILIHKKPGHTKAWFQDLKK